jgi:hypothetical protein
MFLNALRIRLGLIAAGIIVTAAYMLCGGSLLPGSEARILIEFGTDPDQFAGLDVEIDGAVAGKLERIGQATRTAFPVEPGIHQVRVVGPAFDSRPVPIEAANPGMSTMVLLEYGESPDGRLALVLH